MIEKLLENWLDKTTERSFQIPFSYILSGEGHTIIHITRHCGMEMGKDILTIASDRVPCAYQLKSAQNGRITLRQWRAINNQITDLVYGKIVHPSIESKKHHRSYLVTNGFLEEEVSRAIDDFNRTLESQNLPKLEVITKGDILEKAKNLQANLWPSELKDAKILLEIFLESGNSNIPKDKLALLFETILLLDYDISRSPSKAHCARAISSCALLCAIATSEFSNCDNYAAEIEAWTIFASYVLACAERWSLNERYWEKEIEIAQRIIYNALHNLYEEFTKRTHFVEGDPLSDQPFYRCRITWMIALMSIFALWRKYKNESQGEVEEGIRKFCLEKREKMWLWGEATIIQFLAFYWYYRKIDATPSPDFLLRDLIKAVIESNKSNKEGKYKANFLASPYYSAEEIIPHKLGFTNEPLEDSFEGESYTLEGLMHLFVRKNWKLEMKFLWPDISRMKFIGFKSEERWQYCLWRCKRGTYKTKIPPLTQNWGELKKVANKSKGSVIPCIFKRYPILFLLFLCVCPHRATPSSLRWLDSQLMKL